MKCVRSRELPANVAPRSSRMRSSPLQRCHLIIDEAREQIRFRVPTPGNALWAQSMKIRCLAVPSPNPTSAIFPELEIVMCLASPMAIRPVHCTSAAT